MPKGASATGSHEETARAAKRSEAWERYNRWLTGELDQPLFGGKVSLRQVYLPLRAYREEVERHKEVVYLTRDVSFLDFAVSAWLKSDDRRDTIRLVCGGPGYGKSSFAKTVCEVINQSTSRNIRALYVPLQQLDLTEGVGAPEKINSYLRKWGFDFCDPFDRQEPDRLLLVPDGLDELAMQDDSAREAAIAFVREIIEAIRPLNAVEPRVRCLVCGRDIIIQAVTGDLQAEEQVWHLLPYYIPPDEIRGFESATPDASGIITRTVISYRARDVGILYLDQRPEWWARYGKATQHPYDDLPRPLRTTKLDTITSVPLLNYLLALSFERGKIRFTSQSTRNEIYFDLIDSIYERDWTGDKPKNVHTRGLSRAAFVRILEAVATVAWRSGDARTARVSDIKTHCEGLGLLSAWEKFASRADEGLTRIFTAFYIRYQGFGAGTVEFSHKSFGEYLTARAIVNEWERLVNHNGGRTPRLEFLGYWLECCGHSALDPYILEFIRDEIALREPKAEKWQTVAEGLLQHSIDHGMPVDHMPDALKPTEAIRQSRNAVEALLAVHSSCGRVTGEVSELVWRPKMKMHLWLTHLHGEHPDERVVNYLLNHLTFGGTEKHIHARGLYLHQAELTGSRFSFVDFVGVVLSAAELSQTRWHNVILGAAALDRATLDGAEFHVVNFDGAMLSFASFVGADLEEAAMRHTNLSNANLTRAKLRKADLSHATLNQAILTGASLDATNFQGASLNSADLSLTSASETQMTSTTMTGAVCTRSNLTKADLSYSDLNDADFTGANLQWALLIGSSLLGANLEKARMENADLRGANLSGIRSPATRTYWNGIIVDNDTKLPDDFPHSYYSPTPHNLIPGASFMRRTKNR